MTAHHPTLAPSSWPAIIHCGHYQSRNDTTDSNSHGTEQHKLLEDYLHSRVRLKDGDPSHQQIAWAVREVCRIVGISEADLLRGIVAGTWRTEQRIVLVDEDWTLLTFGSADLVGPDWIFDLKSLYGGKDAYEQMCAYALGEMDARGLDEICVGVVHSALHESESYLVTRMDALAVRDAVIARRKNPGRPRKNDRCTFCAKQAGCPEWTVLAQSMPVPSEPMSIRDACALLDKPVAELTEADRYQISALDLWLRSAKGWLEVTHDRIKKMVLDGVEIPEMRVVERAGKAEVEDVGKAFDLLNVPTSVFMAACDLSLPKITKEMSVQDLENAFRLAGLDIPDEFYGAKGGLLKSKMGAAVKLLLKDHIQIGAPTQSAGRLTEVELAQKEIEE